MRRTTSGLRGADDASDSSGDGGYVDGRRSFFKKKTATADPLRSVEEGYYRAPDGGRARSKSPKARSRQPTIAFSSVGGGTVVSTLDDTLGCRCSFHLPSNVQIFRMFACMIVGILLVKVSFAPGDRGFTRRGNRHSGIRNFDLRQLYEKSDLASTQANFGTVRLGDVRLGGDAARGGARDARRGGNGAEYGTSTDGDDAAFGAAPTPLKISRIVHQTYKSKDVPERMKPFMETWRAMNPGWEMRFYDDEGCTEFVKREFPEYYDAYAGLPKHVERSDFFRYLVVLREGGVYADIDTSCEKPLDSFINANDTLVVGWENEFDTDEMAYSRHFVRRRQVLNWAFAGAAGHPALRETCDHVNENYQRIFTNNTNRDTLERTGPGAFTDYVMKSFWRHSPANRDAAGSVAGMVPWGYRGRETEALGRPDASKSPWNVRVLSKVAFGTHPTGEDGVSQDDPGVLIAHHYLGSWKSKQGWTAHKKGIVGHVKLFVNAMKKDKQDLVNFRAELSRLDENYAMPDVNPNAAYPVSAAWEPPFDVLTPLLGSDASTSTRSTLESGAAVTARGRWQAGVWDPREPTSADALVGSLAAHDSNAVLVDVGAGIWFFSLAAAARGRRALAFESAAAAASLVAASIAHNDFGHLVRLDETRVGGKGEAYCEALLKRAKRAAKKKGTDATPATTATEEALRLAAAARRTATATEADTEADTGTGTGTGTETRRFPFPATNDAFRCELAVEAGTKPLDDLIPRDVDVAAMRVASDGWETHVLEGARRLLAERPPPIVLLELTPRRTRGASRDALADARATLEWMFSLGYDDVAHSGAACDERWENMTNFVNNRGGLGMETAETMKQPTWCHVSRADIPAIVERADEDKPESILFHHKREAERRKNAPPRAEARTAPAPAARTEAADVEDSTSTSSKESDVVDATDEIAADADADGVDFSDFDDVEGVVGETVDVEDAGEEDVPETPRVRRVH